MKNAVQKARVMTFEIYRFDPDQDDKPRMQTYQLDVSKIAGSMVLDAIIELKKEDSTLSIRRSCREGVCGSDGMSINGKNGLACTVRLSDLPDKVSLRPLPGLPIVKDLIVDMTQFYDQFDKIKPYLINDKQPEKENLQTPEEHAKLDGLYECIMCACCTTSCPSFWWNPDKFLGPQALLQAYRFIADSRDTAKTMRLEALKDPFSLFRCRGIMNCVNVCPKGLNPTKAINAIRKELLKEGC